ncbi:MBL fold metallo-hydrolase [Litorilituus lipolyticus]|uniref:MBL fold metallo-hydrolase n=1 Tax=Litorilituus lipolyticus TaxID=2491017 RepID=A0A502KVC8_9GAMM|nr:MBL fold metallo-hydrolase [Litorilituus lipolyticus]TPH15700.1 MBL fold metallo-hydrolase [Litorilituus lipolyticus]
MKLYVLSGYIQEILLVEYPDKLLLLDGCSRADVTTVLNFISNTLSRSPSDLKLITVTHMHPDHAGAANKLRKLTGCNIACAKKDTQWYRGFSGKLMHITDILLTRYVANKMQKRQRWLWYSSTLKADIQLTDGDLLPGFDDWQVLTTPGHTDRDISLYHLPSKRVYIADLIVATKKGFIPPFPIFYPNNYQKSLKKIASLAPSSVILAHGGEVTITNEQINSIQKKAPTEPMTHWRLIQSKLKQICFSR